MTRRNLFPFIAAPQVFVENKITKAIGKKDKYKNLLYEAANYLESKIRHYNQYTKNGTSIWVLFHTSGSELAIDNADRLTYGALLSLIDNYIPYGGYYVIPSTREVIASTREAVIIMSSDEANRRFSF